jgi:hypothetical protein
MAKIFNQNQLQSIDLNQVPIIKNSLEKNLIIEKCGFDFDHHLNDQDFQLQPVTIWQPKSNPKRKVAINIFEGNNHNMGTFINKH